MRVALRDPYSYEHCIDSENLELLGKWLSDLLPQALSVNAALPPWQLQVWARTPREMDMIGTPREYPITREGLKALAELFEKASEKAPTKAQSGLVYE